MIPQIRRHIFLCCDQTKPKCCTKEAGLESWDYLKRRLAELGLLDRVYRTKANCLRVCEGGSDRAGVSRKASGITRRRPKCWSGSSRST